MLLKVIIVLLFIAVLISLSSALVFLMKDVGNSRKRILYALGIRIALAVALVGTIAWGIYSGQLTSQAPWDKQLHPARVAPSVNEQPVGKQ
jgi:hypothetical protein